MPKIDQIFQFQRENKTIVHIFQMYLVRSAKQSTMKSVLKYKQMSFKLWGVNTTSSHFGKMHFRDLNSSAQCFFDSLQKYR